MKSASYLLACLERTYIATSREEDYWNTFKRFRDHVSPELSQVNWLFPEFTPHDEAHHISSLLLLTDQLLGETLISRLNACELFILACSLYGHDWGMAVSRDERDAIFSVATSHSPNDAKFALLPNESHEIRTFFPKLGNGIKSVSDDAFRDYVRHTHPIRAKCRIQNWFRDGKRRLGEVVGTVSEGHWYDIQKVRTLPRACSVDGYTVNIAALTAYVRLVDLLDISANRTPFKLWKFVNPRDPFSAMEWKKHEALSPVTVDQPTGVIRIHGSTDDYRVEANLQDLRQWCELQFDETRDLLTELGSPYDPGLHRIEWKVEAIGFTPAHVQFRFDRDQMFDLIADEIYESDPFVFLRELLQNAIDAIVLRTKQTSRTDPNLSFDRGLIEIEIVQDGSRTTEIRVKDNGIGMDLNTVENYLAVVGKSYYRSDDFRRLDLPMNPISRFGIGILSCFMVATSITIATRKDRLFLDSTQTNGGLDIEIPDVRHQFHIKPSTQDWTGTEVKVILCPDKVGRLQGADFSPECITSFLRTVVGICPARIRVSCNGTVVSTIPAVRFDERCGFVNDEDRLQFCVDTEGAFGLTNIADAQAIFTEEKRLVVRETISQFEVEAVVAYFERRPHILPLPTQGQIKFPFLDLAANAVKQVKWKNKNETTSSRTPCWNTNLYERIFVNGILVPEVDLKITWGGHLLPEPRVTVNIKAADDTTRTSISRRKVAFSVGAIADALTGAFHDQIHSEFQGRFECSSPRERLLLFSEVLRSRHMTPTRLAKIWPMEEWPVPVFTPAGISCEFVRDIKLQYTAVELLPFQYLIDNLAYFIHGSVAQDWLGRIPPMITEFSEGLPRCTALTSDLIFSNYRNQFSGDVGYDGLTCLLNGPDQVFHPSGRARVTTAGGKNWLLHRLTCAPDDFEQPNHLNDLVDGFINGRAPLRILNLEGVDESVLGVVELAIELFQPGISARRLILNSRNSFCQCFLTATERHAKEATALIMADAEKIKELLTNLPFFRWILSYEPALTETLCVNWLTTYCNAAVAQGWLDAAELLGASSNCTLVPVYGGWR